MSLRCHAQASAAADLASKAPKDVRVLVVGCTGYIGKFVTRELVRRGYNVVAFTREQAGIKGKLGKDDIVKVGLLWAVGLAAGGGRAVRGARSPQGRVPWPLP